MQVHYILDEIVMAGMVLETSLKEIVKAVNGTAAYEKATEEEAYKKSTKTTKIGMPGQ